MSGEICRPVCRICDNAHPPLNFRISIGIFLNEIRIGNDNAQNIIEVMGYAANQGTQTLHLLQLDNLLLGLL